MEAAVLERPTDDKLNRIVFGTNKRVFVADSGEWQEFYKRELEDLVGEGGIIYVDSVSTALGTLERELHFTAYVIDPTLSFVNRGDGLDIANKARELTGKSDVVWIVSNDNAALEKARQTGYKRLYSKSSLNPNGYKPISEFVKDIRQALGRK